MGEITLKKQEARSEQQALSMPPQLRAITTLARLSAPPFLVDSLSLLRLLLLPPSPPLERRAAPLLLDSAFTYATGGEPFPPPNACRLPRLANTFRLKLALLVVLITLACAPLASALLCVCVLLCAILSACAANPLALGILVLPADDEPTGPRNFCDLLSLSTAARLSSATANANANATATARRPADLLP